VPAPIRLTLQVNGAARDVTADPDMPLLWVLRDLLGLTGTKYGCGMMVCGACTVHLDGQAVKSCRLPVGTLAGRQVTTIEGLAGAGQKPGSHPVQQAWVAEQVPQCGYCQTGQIMAAAALLAQNPAPSDQQITTAMDGNLCRCGTYLRIRRAIHRAARTPGGR
jgi:isoquinoline 1-oxidoreductase alpha subunit